MAEVELVEQQQAQPSTGTKTDLTQREGRDHLHTPLLVLNFIIMVVGTTCAPLVLRLYFLKGGRSKWLTCSLGSAGCPINLVPLALSYYFRRKTNPATKPYLMTRPLLVACTGLGVLNVLINYLYVYASSCLPVSTSTLLYSTQLGFIALFALVLVRQRFTPYSINAVLLLTVGMVVLGTHSDGDRPRGEGRGQYYAGFVMMLGAAALYGLTLPLMELLYSRAGQAVTYTLVMEMQLVIGLFATAICVVGMAVNKDFQVIAREAKEFELGEARYCMLLISAAILWQMCSLGSVGAVFYASALLAGVITATLVPVTELLAVIFFHESFTSDKGVALGLSLWGFVSYFYKEFKQNKENNACD